jgi:hypothetical protein
MSLYVFAAICVVGVDFLIYFLFQWMYGDARRTLEKKLEAQRNAMRAEVARPFVVQSARGGAATRERIRKVRERMTARTA